MWQTFTYKNPYMGNKIQGLLKSGSLIWTKFLIFVMNIVFLFISFIIADLSCHMTWGSYMRRQWHLHDCMKGLKGLFCGNFATTKMVKTVLIYDFCFCSYTKCSLWSTCPCRSPVDLFWKCQNIYWFGQKLWGFRTWD